MERLRRYNNQGQLLVELLVALAMMAILIPAVTAGFIASRQGKAQERQRLEATALAREAGEAVRVVRDAGWSNVATNGTYHPEITGATWTLASGSATIHGYTQSVTIGDVSPPDPSKKLITVTVSWGTPINSTVTNSFYMTRLTNLSWVQTTQADFDAGMKTDVVTTNVNGGEVTLGAGGKGDWCAPTLSIAAVDLPKQGIANAISAIQGTVFAGTGENASGVSYATVAISDTDPPIGTVSATYDGFKTNGIFGEQNYAYLATDNNFKEIEIINLTTNPYAEAGYFDAPGKGNGNSVYVSGNVGYMMYNDPHNDTFYTFDLTSRLNSRTKLGEATLPGTGKRVVVVGNYAYVATTSTSEQMDIFDVSNPASPSKVSKIKVNNQAGVDVFVDSTGTRAYLITAYSGSENNFFIIDTSTKSEILASPIGSTTTNGMSPKGVTVVPGNKAIVVGTGGSLQYQVFDLTDETQPGLCTSHGRSGGLAIATGVNGVASILESDGDAYSYIITGDASTELKIIEGGPGGKYANSGTFESSTFDATSSAAFNRFVANAILPNNTTVQYQVSGADPVNNSCAGLTFTYVGPDGTGNTKFSTGSAIPLSPGPGYVNPAQCFRYKAFLSTNDTFSEPILTDITVNYSP
jgi:type II secretory pathway pseudopilin PulG